MLIPLHTSPVFSVTVVFETVSLYSPGWPGTPYGIHAALKLMAVFLPWPLE